LKVSGTGSPTPAGRTSDGILSVGDKITIPFDVTLLTSTTLTLANITLNGAGATTFTAAVDGKNVVLTMTAVHADDVRWHLT
jgi:hypothetical protein